MEDNTFKLDTQKIVKKNFLKNIRGIFSVAIFLTGMSSIAGLVFIIRGLVEQIWKEIGVAAFVEKGFFYFSIICIFISLINILIDDKPFSRTLSYCIQIISILYLIGAVLFPRLSGYRSSGFEIFSSGDFVLIDGNILLFGSLLYILSVLIREGFKLQKELDEIL